MVDKAIIEMVCNGFTRPEIAKKLNLSKQAIDKRLKKIFKKYDVKTKSELILKIKMLQVFHELM